MLNGQTILTSCRIQEAIALSSGEAELKATCRGLTEALGIREALEFVNQQEIHLSHWTDSTAAYGVLKRKGSGGIKHLTVRQLWTQEVFQQPLTTTDRMPRLNNPADALCSASTTESLARHLTAMHFEITP